MKKTMMKWLMLVAAFGLMVTNVAEAAFRVKTPTAAVRQQALMSLQSVGAGDEETVETTTKEKPFSVDFAALGVENPTNAYLLIMNEQTGNAIALEASDANESKLELPPLALAELEMQHLGASQSYRCMTMCATASGKDEMVGSQKLASSLATVKLPQFSYKDENGAMKVTETGNRQFAGCTTKKRMSLVADDDGNGNLTTAEKYLDGNTYYVYSYVLPDGTVCDYRENDKMEGDIMETETLSVKMGALTFNLNLSIYSGATAAEKTAITKACEYVLQLYSKTFKGSTPVAISLGFFPSSYFASENVLADSAPPPGVLDGNVYYLSTLYNQMVGMDKFPDNDDISIRYNISHPFYWSSDGKCPSGKFDFPTILLHEMAHGMGFADNVMYEPGNSTWHGAFFNPIYNKPGYVGWADYPNCFAKYLYCNGSRIENLSQSARANAFISNSLYWDGSLGKKANGNSRIKIYAPTTYSGGSTGSHFDQNVSFTTFMKPATTTANVIHYFDDQILGVFEDMGWTFKDNIPDAPTNVSATKGTIIGEVDVTWNSSNGATSYNVYRSTSASGTYSSVKTGLTSCKYQDKNVSGTTKYYYKVAAVNSAGTSAQSSYDYGYAKEEPPVIDHIEITGPATLNGGDSAAYTCTAYYSDGSSKDVSNEIECVWTLPYGSGNATLSGHRLTAGYLTAKKTATIRATYGGKTAEFTVTIIPRTVDVTFSTGLKGFFPDPDGNAASVTTKTLTFVVNSTYGDLPVPTTRSGYKFEGWYTASSGGTKITATSTVSGTITQLYAQYSVAEPTVVSVRTDAPTTLECGSTRAVKAYASYTDGTEKQVTAGMQWSISNSGIPYTISDGVLTLNPSATATGTIRITVTVSGVSSPTYTVTSVNPTKTITLNANGGTVSPTSISQKQGSAFASLPTPTRTGYNFLGWYTASSGGTRIQDGTVYDGSYTTLYARWEYIVLLDHITISGASSIVSGGRATYTVTANFSDGTTQSNLSVNWSANSGSISSDGVFIAPTVTANTSVTITASYTCKGVTKTASLSVTVIPKTVTVTFDANGGSASPSSKEYVVGLQYGTLASATRTNWDFVGWFTARIGGTMVTSGTVATESVTALYAHWEKTLKSIAISGASSVASGSTNEYVCTATWSDNSTSEGVSAAWSATHGAIDDQGVFVAPLVTNVTYVTISASYTAKGVTKTATKTVTVMPKVVAVSFDANGGTVSPSTIEYTVGMAYGELPTPTWAEHVFDGWFTALDETGIPVTAETPVIEDANTLYAKWHDEFLIRGLTIIGPNSLESGATATYSCLANYSDGSTADVTPAWSFVSGGSYATITAGGVLSANQTTTSRTVVLKATFSGLSTTITIVIRPKTVTVAFDAHGGMVAEASRSYVIGAKYSSFPSTDYAGHRFLGWFTAATGGTRIYETTVVSASVVTLHAQWQENPPALKEIFVSCEQETPVAVSGATLQLICSAVYTNGAVTTTNVLNGSDVTWTTDDSSVGTVGSGGVFMAGRVTSPSIAIVTARYQGMTSPEFAVWVEPEKATVTFNANGGTVSEASREYVVGAAYGSLPVATPSSADYRFDGWFTAVNGGMRVTETAICDKTVTTLYAQWSEIIRLSGLRIEGENVVTSSVPATFTCYGIYSDGSEVLATPDWSVVPAALGVMDAEGTFTAAYVTEETLASVMAVVGSVTGTLEVAIQPLEVSVRFDPCNGAVTPQRMTFIVGAAYGELPTPVRSRYDFDGWFTREGKSGDLITAESTVSADVETLYAGWSPTPHSLTGIRIEGVEAVTSGGSAVFSCKAVYSDGTEGSIVPVWSVVKGLDYASLTLSGFFMAEEVAAEQKVTIQAVYTDKGIRYEDQHEVRIMPSTLVVDPDTMSLEADAQRASLLVDAYGSWRVSVDVDWITLDKTSGSGIDTVGFGVTANEDKYERIGTITVMSDGLMETCVVKQYSPVPDEYVMVTLDTRIPGQTTSQRQCIKGRKFGYLPTPVRTGYAFGGWWTLPNGAGTRVHAMTVVSDDTLALYGHWTDVSVSYALNNALDWVEDAAHPWAFDYTEAMDRKVSMTTPALGNRQSSSLSALVEGPGSISFYWRTSSEEYFDTLALYVDGKFVASVSGETGWKSLSKAITGYGQHVITWTYAKDGQGSAGMDCARLDMVTWIPNYAGSGAASIQSADGRAVPETWLNAYGLDTRSASIDEDADGDGMTNYEEYIAGTDPLDPESKFALYIEMGASGIPQIEAVPDLGDTETRAYIFEGKESLSDEHWSPADEAIHHFFRVRIEVR